MKTVKKIADRIVGSIVLLLVLSFFDWGVKVAAAAIVTSPVWGPWLVIRAAAKRRSLAQESHEGEEAGGPEGVSDIPPPPAHQPVATYEGYRVFPLPPLE
ncbi:hypothetical protein SCA03_29780 [Streptomyces cacaoi]|uniref:Uncharacterized protein n=1 Tax=Streptomyces cacaoi TaxID=1898 RepID=A0A4Y3R0I2_STRCI|nr:hypothetical protein SCA03_29780 [Streptomyces cacaoi]